MKEEKIGGNLRLENRKGGGGWQGSRAAVGQKGGGAVAQPKLGYASFGSAHLKQFYCCKTQTQLPVHAIYNEWRAGQGRWKKGR